MQHLRKITPLFLSHQETFQVSVHHIFHLKKHYNYQASPQVYLNIAEVLKVSRKMAKALHKDIRGATISLHGILYWNFQHLLMLLTNVGNIYI